MSIGGARLKNGLTERQDVFVKTYLSNGFNAEQAAIAADYAPKNARQRGTELLNNDRVKKVLDSERKRIANKFDVTREYILKGLCGIFDGSDNDKTRIAAASEINRMCGFNEPERKEINIQGVSTVLLIPSNGR